MVILVSFFLCGTCVCVSIAASNMLSLYYRDSILSMIHCGEFLFLCIHCPLCFVCMFEYVYI